MSYRKAKLLLEQKKQLEQANLNTKKPEDKEEE